jgi:Ca2+-binding RTX toxin-like protein
LPGHSRTKADRQRILRGDNFHDHLQYNKQWPGERRTGRRTLNLTYNTTTSGVWLLGLTVNISGGYDGVFDGFASNDTNFTGIENFGFTDLSGGNDIIRTGDGNDSLNGGAGNDELYGGAGDDTIDGGDGIDVFGVDLSASSLSFTINLNTVSTLITGTVRNVEGFKNLVTGSGNDWITNSMTAGINDTLSTGAGNDRIKLYSGGTDSVDGGTGDDRLTVIWNLATDGVWLQGITANAGGGYDGQFDGFGSNDVNFTGIESFAFFDQMAGNDIIRTGAGDDKLIGGGGNDFLDAGSGSDTLHGGAGIDVYLADQSALTSNVVMDLNKTSTVNGGTIQKFESFGGFVTGSGNDLIINHESAAQGDTISAGAGDDRIKLYSGGTDSIDGGTGDDRLILIWNSATNGVWLQGITANAGGGYDGQFNGLGSNDVNFTGIEKFRFTDLAGGNDIINTGAGDDMLSGGGGNDTLNGGAGNDSLFGGIAADSLDGGNGNDRLWGDNGFDTLRGGNGNDTIQGGNGWDELIGGNGRDRLNGGTGNDTMTGGNGNDTLNGDADNDILRGGAGVDTFMFDGGADRIKDFSGDLLMLDDALWGGTPLTNAQILAFATPVSGDTVFDFGSGNTLTIENYVDIAALDPVLSVF